MRAATTPLPQQTPAAAGFDVDELESALRQGWRRLRFLPRLEAAYERDTGMGRTLRHVFSSLIGVGAFWLLSASDPDRLPDIGQLLTLLRLLAALSCLGVIATLFVCRKSLQAWHRETMSAGGTLLLVGYGTVVSHHVHATLPLMQLSGMLLIFLHVGIGARLQFRYALAVNLITYFLWAALTSADGAQANEVWRNMLLLLAMVLSFSTIGTHLLEFRERRSYLLQCLKAKRHDILLSDAEILRELAMRDGLTKLYNRRHFDTELARAWHDAERSGRTVAVLQVDADHFKRYNDHYGHPAGDRCLVRIGAVLVAVAERSGGIAARVGGEEFALLIPAVDPGAVASIADDICRSVRALGLPHEKSSCAPHVTVSVGVAVTRPVPGSTPSALVGAADAALYAAKRQGRDRWTLHEQRHPEPAAPSGVRPSGDSLSPEPQAIGGELVLIERLSLLLAGRLRWLRFPPDLENEFQERGADARRRLLALLMLGGTAVVPLYVLVCAAVLGDVADVLLHRVLWLALPAVLAAVLNLQVRLPWQVREGTLAAFIGTCGMCIVWTEAAGSAPTVYIATLGVCLLPMFGSLIAAQPLRFSVLPSLLICFGVATLMQPELAERRLIWSYTAGVICVATLYSLVGGYLLELSNRRAYLLDRLRVAQLAVLRHNTEHLQRLATVDPLTRLPNRRHFEAELQRLSDVCMASGQPLALLILDIDHFKRYNDGYGHPAGDACLQRVGAALAHWVRSGAGQAPGAAPAVPARMGGEEFGVLLPGSDGTAALASAQRLRLVMRELRIEHAHTPVGRFLTVSVGAASLVLGSAADARLLLQAADAALYRAKGLGRDQAAA